jgi:hypothetical protein
MTATLEAKTREIESRIKDMDNRFTGEIKERDHRHEREIDKINNESTRAIEKISNTMTSIKESFDRQFDLLKVEVAKGGEGGGLLGTILSTMQTSMQNSNSELNKLVMESLAQGHPITNFIARPLGANRTYFLENGITPSELAARAKDRFTDALPGGQIRLHGACRGSIQHARFVEGKPHHLVQEHAQIRCEHIMRVYENPEGHNPPALERIARAKKIRLS